jgi:Ca-activated chloride channel family protein
MIAVDVSPSMLVEDIKPNRLERARREIIDFLKVVQGDRVGLIAFSGAAFIQCPLTLDYAAIEMFLNALQPDLIPVPGTDLGEAIKIALSSFDFKAETDKVILLITDGEDNEGQGFRAAREAKEKGIKIFVFGMGETSGAPVPAGEGKVGFKKDKDGKLILSKLKEDDLKKIASMSGGTYVRSVTGDLDLDLLYFEGIRSMTDTKTLKSGKIRVFEERFMFFVLAAFLFLLLEGSISERKSRGMPS